MTSFQAMELAAVTDEQIYHVAREVLGEAPMRIVRTFDDESTPRVYLIARVHDTECTWRVRFSTILDDHLAFDRIQL